MKRTQLLFFYTFLTIQFSVYSQNSDFKSIQIGKQIWMANNLNSSVFQDRTPIFEAKTVEEWRTAGSEKRPAWCYYGNDSSNGIKYGRIYNWYAVSNPLNVCPAGWNVASDKDWNVLEKYLGLDSAELNSIKDSRGSEAKLGLKLIGDNNLWNISGDSVANIKSSGFNAIPAGQRNPYGEFSGEKEVTLFWTSTGNSKKDEKGIFHNNPWMRIITGKMSRSCLRDKVMPTYGFSVRCVKKVGYKSK